MTRPRARLGRATLDISGSVAGLACAGAALLFAWSTIADAPASQALALLILAVGLFASHALPGYLTALILFLLAILTGVAPPAVVFSSFQSGGVWLTFSGIIIGFSVGEVGLGAYVTRKVLARFELTYAKAAALLVAVSVLLSFVIPATIPRLIVLLPVALALADTMGYPQGSRGYAGLVSAVVLGSMLPAFSIMPATLPGVVMVGAIETVYGFTPTYAAYLLYLLPVGVLRALAVLGIVIMLFNEAPKATRLKAPSDSLTSKQKKLLAILCGALFFWMTDFVHQVAPAWVSMGAAIIILLPGIGVLEPAAVRDRVNLAPVFYIAGILSIGAIVTHSGLDQTIAKTLLGALRLQPGGDFLNFFAIFGLSMLAAMMLTQPASPALLVPLASRLSEATGLDLSAVLMTQLLGLSTMILPYQAPPLIVGLGMGRLHMGELARPCAAVAAVVVVVGVPLTFLWWQGIGLLP